MQGWRGSREAGPAAERGAAAAAVVAGGNEARLLADGYVGWASGWLPAAGGGGGGDGGWCGLVVGKEVGGDTHLAGVSSRYDQLLGSVRRRFRVRSTSSSVAAAAAAAGCNTTMATTAATAHTTNWMMGMLVYLEHIRAVHSLQHFVDHGNLFCAYAI